MNYENKELYLTTLETKILFKILDMTHNSNVFTTEYKGTTKQIVKFLKKNFVVILHKMLNNNNYVLNSKTLHRRVLVESMKRLIVKLRKENRVIKVQLGYDN